MEALPLFNLGFRWKLGNGRRILFWFDNWFDEGVPLLQLGATELSENVTATVSDLWDPTRGWTTEVLAYPMAGISACNSVSASGDCAPYYFGVGRSSLLVPHYFWYLFYGFRPQ